MNTERKLSKNNKQGEQMTSDDAEGCIQYTCVQVSLLCVSSGEREVTVLQGLSFPNGIQALQGGGQSQRGRGQGALGS